MDCLKRIGLQWVIGVGLSSVSFPLWADNSLALCNFLGGGLKITLSSNATETKPYTLAEGEGCPAVGAALSAVVGTIPCSMTDATKNWSTWDVTDSKGHYYGTFVLSLSDQCKTVELTKYTGGDGYYLVDIKFPDTTCGTNTAAPECSAAPNYRGISVRQIFRSDLGPFQDAPLAQPAVYPGTTRKIMLSVQGNRIMNDRGQTVILKGVARPSLEWNSQGQYFSIADIQNMKKWGANAIRISLKQQRWFESDSITTIGSYKQIIDAIIYYAIKEGMAVILDLHWTTADSQTPMANRDSIRFWTEVASQYKDFGTVLFELFNEPCCTIDNQLNVWLKGDAQYAGFQELYDAVRTTGAQNICLVSGRRYGFDLSFITQTDKTYAVQGTNIAYDVHPYSLSMPSDQRTAEQLIAATEKSLDGILGTYPVIMTEFGDNNKSDYPTGYLPFYRELLDFINQHQIGYTAWAWWVQADNPAFPTMVSDWNGTPMNGGILIQQDMSTDHPPTPLG
ncbi:MAG: hypothetical protein A3J38_07305 [Gammaproteobacteria bacterium RIFCSPHIGHO2_12_FULL_45_9]|nr:MAG: hypothetical protein A3J38_07305 [Gammaproteobacteria bacterium RIFCSPHIGHO2_12_FULL_45_9]